MKKTISLVCLLLSATLLFTACTGGAAPATVGPAEAVYGEWVEDSSNVLFIFNADGSCYFYKDANDLDDNYYFGDEMLILNGQDAFDDLGITADTAESVKLYQDPSKVYSMKLYYTGLFSEGISKNDMIPAGAYDWYMFIITGEDTAIAANMTTFSVYELTRVA